MSQKTQMVLGFFYLSHTLDLKARVDYCYDIKVRKEMNELVSDRKKYPGEISN